MASSSSSSFLLIAICSLLFTSTSFAKTSFLSKTKALLLQVTKDPKTLQYVTQINQRTPLVSIPLTVDLGGRFLWTDCGINGYDSSTYQFYDCNSTQCRLTRERTFCDRCDFPGQPGCHVRNSSCAQFVMNPYSFGVAGALAGDVLSIQSTNGQNPTGVVSVPQFFFFCTNNELGVLKGLADGVKGIVGLGRTSIALPSQLGSFFNFRKIFALCLSPYSKGVIFFGEGPYQFLPNVNAASNLTYTPLIVNKGSYIEKPSSDYFIEVTSIKIAGKAIPVNTTLLAIDQNGEGGTKISTTSPYTELTPQIYDVFINAYFQAMSNFTRVTSVAPFEACYTYKTIGVPVIDLVLQSEEVYWRIRGPNSMVQVSKDVMCLGIVKQKPTTPWPAITIGGYQLENNLVQFNIAKSVLGFSSSLTSRGTTCASFNFTSPLPLQSLSIINFFTEHEQME